MANLGLKEVAIIPEFSSKNRTWQGEEEAGGKLQGTHGLPKNLGK
ncbi:hypothetical protein SLEP1_g18761 [Rubroshorea leprosula]|uniref:Uncharacterized protein n=1 Tax=Rubroshorea leprosula TaxID=152421 RepID=A0AAV5J4L9_9ROSI|nr:hypothetical protein SLEP1_g18761 [Rubroshorea leprosula]